MIAFLAAVALVVLSGSAFAQAPQNEGVKSAETELARIRAERKLADEQFAQREIGCYQYFAVNDCLGRARVQRRETVADLRRQELSVNANEARRRGAAQISRTEERMSPEALRETQNRLLDAQAAQRERLEVLDAKAAERATRQEESAARLGDYQARRQAQREAERERVARQSEEDNNRRNYDAKLKAAAERKTSATKPVAAPKQATPTTPTTPALLDPKPPVLK